MPYSIRLSRDVYKRQAQQLENGLLGGRENDRIDRLLGSRYILAECIPCDMEEENLGGLNLLL